MAQVVLTADTANALTHQIHQEHTNLTQHVCHVICSKNLAIILTAPATMC